MGSRSSLAVTLDLTILQCFKFGKLLKGFKIYVLVNFCFLFFYAIGPKT